MAEEVSRLPSIESMAMTIAEYVKDHPAFLYKGLPVIAGAWMMWPVLAVTWIWLPWIYVTYEIYNRVPAETIRQIYTYISTLKT